MALTREDCNRLAEDFLDDISYRDFQWPNREKTINRLGKIIENTFKLGVESNGDLIFELQELVDRFE